MPTWDEVAEKQRETLQGAGVVASDAAAIAALLCVCGRAAHPAGLEEVVVLDLAPLRVPYGGHHRASQTGADVSK